MKYELNSAGEEVVAPVKSAKLIITWHKVPEETYCHNVTLEVPGLPLSLFNPPVVKVEISICTSVKQSSKSYKKIFRTYYTYLPYDVIEQEAIVRIPINSSDLVDAIGLDIRTKNNHLKAYPDRISVDFGGDILSWEIEPLKHPRSISAKYIDELPVGDKLRVVINLDL